MDGCCNDDDRRKRLLRSGQRVVMARRSREDSDDAASGAAARVLPETLPSGGDKIRLAREYLQDCQLHPPPAFKMVKGHIHKILHERLQDERLVVRRTHSKGSGSALVFKGLDVA